MSCKYLSKTGKGCKIMKVDSEHGICNKHLKVYLNKIGKDSDIKYDNPIDEEKERIYKPKSIMRKKVEKENVENEDGISLKEENDLDNIINENEMDLELEKEENEKPKENEQIANKDLQLELMKMAYKTLVGITESMSSPYLNGFQQECVGNENIQKALQQLNEEQNIDILINAGPEYKILIFTGIIAAQKIAQNSFQKPNGKIIKSFEVEEEFKNI